jgi:SHS2 domain-containing protein
LNLSVSAPTLPELFEVAAVELTNQLINAQSVGENVRDRFMIEGENPSRLLQEWINMLLELMRVERMVFSRFHVMEIKGEGPLVLRAEVTGELIDPHRHQFLTKIVGLSCRQADLQGAGPCRADIQIA